VKNRGYCTKHVQRVARHGDPSVTLVPRLCTDEKRRDEGDDEMANERARRERDWSDRSF
jgi:hypothetical protein